MANHRQICAVLTLLLLAALSGPAEARQWKPGPSDAAREYVVIEHSLSEDEFVIVYWLAREVIGEVAEDPSFSEFFESYIMVGVGHITISPLGTFSFTEPEGVVLEEDGRGTRPPLAKETLPPLVAAVEESIGGILAGGMGQFGAAIEWYFFPTEGLDSCEKGLFWIVYGAEKYEYATPIPGCPAEEN